MSLQTLSEQFQPTLIFLGFLSSIFYIGFHYWGRVKLPQKDRFVTSKPLYVQDVVLQFCVNFPTIVIVGSQG
jgi:hypothetical protein